MGIQIQANGRTVQIIVYFIYVYSKYKQKRSQHAALWDTYFDVKIARL